MGQTLKIEKKIVDWEVVTENKKTDLASVIHERPRITEGKTYKIKPPELGAAMYVTINHVTLPDGTKRPVEVFVNTKNVQNQQWIMALTRVISALFRKPGNFEFIIDELEEVVDPNGGYFKENSGGFCKSVVAHLGQILREHCISIGAITVPEEDKAQKEFLETKKAEAVKLGIKGGYCEKCTDMSMVMLDNCLTCTSCGYSKCN